MSKHRTSGKAKRLVTQEWRLYPPSRISGYLQNTTQYSVWGETPKDITKQQIGWRGDEQRTPFFTPDLQLNSNAKGTPEMPLLYDEIPRIN